MGQGDLSDAEWKLIGPLLPPGRVPPGIIAAFDVTPSFPLAGIRAERLFCALARLKQWTAKRSP